MKCCLICQNSTFDILSQKVRDSKNHKIVKCKKCNHIQIYPIPTIEEAKKFYDNNRQLKNIKINFNLKKLEKKSEEDTLRRVEFVAKLFQKTSKILEIGSGYGFFLKAMNSIGYNVTGVEVSKERRNLAKKNCNVSILNINLMNEALDSSKFDGIVIFHVLEHLSKPIRFLENLYKMLKKNGKLIIEVPNVNDFQLKLNLNYRKWYWQRAHLSYFSPRNLKKVLKKAGFIDVKVKGVQRYSIENMLNWKLNKKPQLDQPTMRLSKQFEWLENYYKNYLEKKLECDTLIAIVKKDV